MRIGVIGINYRSSDLAFREQFVRACDLQLGKQAPIAQELSCVILPTCHRMEIYFSIEDLAEGHVQILGVLRQELEGCFEHQLYTYFGIDCFNHLARVTAGLDSLILGESEIQKQVKGAYALSSQSYRLSRDMHYLFQKSLKVGKMIRSSGVIEFNANSLPHILWQVSRSTFSHLDRCRLLFVGNSEINRRTMVYFQRKGIRDLTICTRQTDIPDSAQHKIEWHALSSWIDYDIIVCGTYCEGYLLTMPFECINQNRLVFDLSVPRTVDPVLNTHPHVMLLNMEALGHLIERKTNEQVRQRQKGELIVDQLIQRYVQIFYQKQRVQAGIR